MSALKTKNKLNQVNFNNYIIKTTYLKKPFVAVAVSGDSDSMALLFLVNNWIKTVKGSVIAIIANHGLRENSKEEAKLVQNKIKLKIKTKLFQLKQIKLLKKI